ncbi:MAG: LamG-like jellyroll fold domain-containing protein [Candidatus Kerfeldbacteria bacterium]
MRKNLLWSLFLVFIIGISVFTASSVSSISTPKFEMDTDPTYVTGKFGQALKVGQDDVPIYTYNGHEGLNPIQGTIEAWVKPNDWTSDSNGYWEILSAVNQDKKDIFEFRRGKDTRYDLMQFIAYKSNGSFQAWRNPLTYNFTWQNNEWAHLVMTWSETDTPTVYVNGVAHEFEGGYGETTWDIRDFTSGKIFLGQRGNEYVRNNNYYNHAGRATFDEVRVSSKVRSEEEIIANYNSGNGKLLTADEDTLWLAHFDSSLDIDTYTTSSDNALWLKREVRKCDDQTINTTHPNEGDQDFEVGSYSNYTCGNRHQAQCNNDGTFDNYYSETCYYKKTGERVTSTTLKAVQIDGAYLKAEWVPAIHNDKFESYVLAISYDDDTPSYPENNTGWSSNVQTKSQLRIPHSELYFNDNVNTKLEIGKTYHVAIGVRDTNGHVKMSNAVEFTVPDFKQFFAYNEKLSGGYNIFAKDTNGNGIAEIITGTGDGLGPQISIFNSEGVVLGRCFAYAEHLRSGVRVTVADLDGDNSSEIITAAGPSGRPHIQIFNNRCQRLSPGFFALDGQFQGGTHVTSGDIDGDGDDEIIVTAGKGGGAQVMAYDKNGNTLLNFFAYDKDTFRGGIKATAIDIDGDGIDEIVTGPEYGSPHIQIFQIRNGEAHLLNPGFYAFSTDFKGGVSVTGADVNGDDVNEIVVSVGHESASLIRVFNKDGSIFRNDYYTYTEDFEGGINVTSGDLNGDGRDEILTIPASEGQPNVRRFNFY